MNKHPVLESIKPVIANSRYAKTNISRIEELAKRLSDFDFPEQSYGVFFPDVGREDIIQFTFVFNSINFQFRDWRTPKLKFGLVYDGEFYGGSFGLIFSLRKAIDDGIPVLDANYLASLSEQEALKFLKRDILIPMFEQRVSILNEVGKILVEKYNGRFSSFLRPSSKAFDNGSGLVELLAKEFPSFNDVRIYRPTNTEVKFYKRAQLMLAMLHCNPKSDFKLENIGELTVFADYKLPQALRDLGILEYSTELAAKIDNFVLVPQGSDEEVEIRAHTIYASDLLCKKVNEHRKDKVTPNQVDEYLWLEGKKSKRPRHFTETTSY